MLSDGDRKAHAKVNGHPYLVSKEECINPGHKKSSKELHLVMVLEVQICNIFLYYFYYLLIYIIFMYYYLLSLYANLLYLYILYYNIIYLICANNLIY